MFTEAKYCQGPHAVRLATNVAHYNDGTVEGFCNECVPMIDKSNVWQIETIQSRKDKRRKKTWGNSNSVT